MHICKTKHLHNVKTCAQYWFKHNFSLWAGVRSYNLTTYTIEMILYSKIVSFSWLAIIWCIQQSLSDYIRYNMATPKLKIHSNHCSLKKNLLGHSLKQRRGQPLGQHLLLQCRPRDPRNQYLEGLDPDRLSPRFHTKHWNIHIYTFVHSSMKKLWSIYTYEGTLNWTLVGSDEWR